jgi:hypothetical protein
MTRLLAGAGFAAAVLTAQQLPTQTNGTPAAVRTSGDSIGPYDKQVVEPAAADRGRTLFAAECVDCHGPMAHGTVTALTVTGLALRAQQGPQAQSWPTYNGDLSGRRFSSLTGINDRNVGSLQLAWTYKVDSGEPGSNNPSGTPLMADGVIYLSTQDHAFAIDATHAKITRNLIISLSPGKPPNRGRCHLSVGRARRDARPVDRA